MATTVTLADVLAGVEERAIALCFSYRMFQDLYCDPINVPIMRDCAPAFFSHLQSVLQDNIYVAIRALTERPPSASFADQRFSMRHLFRKGKESGVALPHSLSDRLDKMCDAAMSVCEHVDARIVHTDARSLSTSNTPLPKVLVTQLDELVELAFELVNAVRAATGKCQVAFERATFNGDGRDLLRQLDQSRRYSRLALWLWSEEGRTASAEKLRDRIRADHK